MVNWQIALVLLCAFISGCAGVQAVAYPLVTCPPEHLCAVLMKATPWPWDNPQRAMVANSDNPYVTVYPEDEANSGLADKAKSLAGGIAPTAPVTPTP